MLEWELEWVRGGKGGMGRCIRINRIMGGVGMVLDEGRWVDRQVGRCSGSWVKNVSILHVICIES